jgi:hypothetical protein
VSITEEDVHRYTVGECWVLAWHIFQELAGRHQPRIIDFDEHVLVQLGEDDRYLDVRGIQTEAELRQVWTTVHLMHPISYNLEPHILPDPEDPENVRAREVARALIARYLPDKETPCHLPATSSTRSPSPGS